MNYEELITELKTILGLGKKIVERIFNKLIIKPALLDSLENVFNRLLAILTKIKKLQIKKIN
ncbi:hypothetical protein [Spiroplasma endosymbiont of Polydrusus pterygomalis]|uniref:hypothetical protein n=1 Tax=Spiroplasma endosymbiont of Polydrusus pterygomalis TaxID=3139327 RepID=UPI003CCA953B